MGYLLRARPGSLPPANVPETLMPLFVSAIMSISETLVSSPGDGAASRDTGAGMPRVDYGEPFAARLLQMGPNSC